jgi:hypothetical protein
MISFQKVKETNFVVKSKSSSSSSQLIEPLNVEKKSEPVVGLTCAQLLVMD